ncbi:MAG: FkbM family methyltransferase [Pseudomonadota bacterium]
MLARTEAYGLIFDYPPGDLAVGACLSEYGEFSLMGMTLASQISRGGGFLDVGANIGAFALPVSRAAQTVVAIEPHPGLVDILQRNVEANGRTNISVVRGAAGAAPGRIDFPTPALTERMNFGSISIERTNAPTTKVAMVRLDDVAPPNLLMVKIDVEGFELEVMRGAETLLHSIRPCWLVEFSDPDLIDLFQGAGYRTYWFFDVFVTPRAPKKRWTSKYRGDMNILAVSSDAPQPVGMVEAAADRQVPRSTAGFEYLRAFGIAPTAS